MNEPNLISSYNYDAFVPEKFERWLNFDASSPLGLLRSSEHITTGERDCPSSTRVSVRSYTLRGAGQRQEEHRDRPPG